MRYILTGQAIRQLRLATLLTIIVSLLINQPLWATTKAESTFLYQDPKTNITLVIAEIALQGYYTPAYPQPAGAISDVVIIDAKLVNPSTDQLESTTNQRLYRIAGILQDKTASKATVTLMASKDNSPLTIELTLNKTSQDKSAAENFKQWARVRFFQFQLLTNPSSKNLIKEIWDSHYQNLYGTPMLAYYYTAARRNNSTADNLSTLPIFGGQAAIRETLQTQLVSDTSQKQSDTTTDEPLVAIDTLKGVEVKAHPYQQMLTALQKTSASTPLHSALANYVPVDRLLIVVKEPNSVAHLLNSDNDISTRLTPLLGKNFASYDLIARYTKRLGLTTEQLKSWLSGHNVAEMAIFTPDVFFLDNTDLTAIIQLKPDANSLFNMAQQLPEVILPIKLPKGDTFYLTSRNNLLLVSSNKAELEKALQLIASKGQGSLGQSDEFKVMSYKLPLVADTKLYVYFSDPFIRRLTSPTVKIAQLRRAIARNTMETITAMALLYKLDQGIEPDSIATLKAKGYLAKVEAPETEYRLTKGLKVISKTWGSLTNLKTLTAQPITHITQQEALDYENYRDRYSAFWSEFFDPIAIRAELNNKGHLALETFILPLIDNSIYMGLKEALGSQSPHKTQLPIYQRTPVASLVVRLPKAQAESLLNDSPLMRVPSYHKLLGLVGETAVLSIQDSAPVVQTNFPGLISLQNQQSFFGVRSKDLLVAPIVGALFTRPVDLAIKVNDEAATQALLKSNFLASFMADRGFFALNSTRNITDNKLLLDLTFAGVIRLELAISVEKGWLHISNHPWTAIDIIDSKDITPSHATIILTPTELKEGLPQLVSLAQIGYREAIYNSAAELLLWMMAYQVDAKQAAELQKYALARYTPLPKEVTLANKSPLAAVPYGTWSKQEMPSTAMQQDAAFVHLLQNLTLWLRFEEDGLRSRVEFISN